MTNLGEPVRGIPRAAADPRGLGEPIASTAVPNPVQHVAWDPAGKWIAATLKNVGLAIVPCQGGEQPTLIRDGTALGQLGLAASPDGTRLAWTYAGGASAPPGGGHPLLGRIRVIDPRTGGDLWSVAPGGLFPKFSPDGRLLVVRRHFGNVSPQRGFLGMHDATDNGRLLWEEIDCNKAEFGFNSGLLVTDGANPQIVFAESGRVKARLAATRELAFGGLSFTWDGSHVAGFGWDPTPGIDWFSMSDGTLRSTTPFEIPAGHPFDPSTRRFALSSDARLVAVGDPAMVSVHDTTTGQPRFSPPVTTLGPVQMLEFSPDNTAVAVVEQQVEVDKNEAVTILDTASGGVLFQTFYPRPDLVSFRPSGGAFAITGFKGDPPASSFFIDMFTAPETGHHVGLLRSAHEFDDPVTAVALTNASSSAALAVTAGPQQRVTLFDANTGDFVRERSISGVVTALALSPTTDYFAVASTDKTLSTFELNGDVRWRANHADKVNAAAISPRTGNLIATGAGVGDKRARLFTRELGMGEDRDDHQPLWSSDQSSPVTRIAISADDQFVATACADKHARLLDAATGHIRKAFRHDDQITAVVFSPAAPLLVTASMDGSVLVIDATANITVHEIGHPRAVTVAAVSSDGSLLATATTEPDSTVRVWRLAEPDQPIHVRQRPTAINAIAFSPTEPRLAIAVALEPVAIIDQATGQEQQILPGATADTIAYSPDGRLLIAASEDAATVFNTTLP